MYLALQHGLFVANYPLVDEDLQTTDLPRPVRDLRERCFGLTTTVSRLSRVRNERRPDSRYASEEQCRFELRRAGDMYETHALPTIDTSAASVEEIAAVIIQTLARERRRTSGRPATGRAHAQGRTPSP
jgi:regulator of PEP synthase PpsR (kinase-PPPase family)